MALQCTAEEVLEDCAAVASEQLSPGVGKAFEGGGRASAGSGMFTSGLTAVEAWLIGLSALSLIGLGVIVWLSLREHAPAATAPSVPQAAFEAAALQLDGQATAILDLVRSYLDASGVGLTLHAQEPPATLRTGSD